MGSMFPRLFPKKNKRAEQLMHEQNEKKGEAYDPEKLPLEKGDFFSHAGSRVPGHPAGGHCIAADHGSGFLWIFPWSLNPWLQFERKYHIIHTETP